MAPAGGQTILHADLDAFYASVEQLLDPRLRGRPIAVGEGVVLAASYEAKALGVGAGMPGWRARQLCPDLQFVGGHFHHYQRLADQVIGILGDFTPLVERISIDEAFLDVAGTEHLFGSPSEIGVAIRRRVRAETGLPVSVGVARTKHLAKIASQAAKPDGLVVVEPDHELEFLHPLSVDLMWGVGPVTRARLASAGIRTIGELAAMPGPLSKLVLGEAAGGKLQALATNIDPRRIETSRRAASVGAQQAFERRQATLDLLRSTLGYLADRVAGRLRAAGQAGRTITVRVRFTGLRSVTRSVTLPVAISTTLTIGEIATELALSVSQLVDQSTLQLQLPLGPDGGRRRPDASKESARWALDRALDTVRTRFGRNAAGYARVMLSEHGGVPEEFRELAEHELRGGRQTSADPQRR
jgi:DNA polymerase IV